MNNSFFTDIKVIRDAIDTKKLVVFAGAGVSIDAGVPSWNTLINEMKSDINIPSNEQDYLRIAQMFFNERQQKEYIDKIRTVLKHTKVKHNAIHEEIFNLNPEHILTTNYDDLFEQVINSKSLPFSVISKDNHFPYALNTKHLVKMHGDLSDTEIVLKEDDYIDYSLKHPLIEGFIKSVFVSKIVLFIGYSFSDINLKMIIQTVRNILGKDFQNAYLLNLDKNFHPTQREYLKNKGIRVINYYDANTDGEIDYISSYLKGANSLQENYYKECKDLSEIGQQLLNFIRFISNYDKFNEPLSNKNVIDQIHDSLMRFSEFKSLPPNFLANLYPFNNSKKYVHHYESNSLLTKNGKLHDLFFNQITYSENNEVIFNPPDELKLSESQIKEYEKKLKDIIKTLNYGLIFYIFKENDKPDSLGNKGWSDNYKKLYIKHPEKCDCLTCRHFRLEISSSIVDTISDNVNESTDISSDFQVAYSNYNLGNFLISFKQFEEIANKAWKTGRYFSYYIAKHNSKTLRNLIDFYEGNINSTEKKEILNTIENIDFDKLLFQIPYLGESEYRLFKIIRDDDILKQANKELDEILKKVKDIYDLYINGGTSMGPYYPTLINLELYKIKSFYINNHIISDTFVEYRRICNKAIEGLFISYAISDKYTEKLKEFDVLFFETFVFYGNTREVKEISEKYAIDNLKFSDEAIPKIIDIVINFLKSFVSDNKHFGINNADNSTSIQLKNRFFENRTIEKFNNIFLLLSGITLDSNYTNSLIDNLVKFLEVENFLYGNSLKYLSSFLYKNHHLFTEKHCGAIFNGPLKKYGMSNGIELLKAIAFVYKKNGFKRISNKALVQEYLHSVKQDKLHLIPLWEISDDDLRKIIVSQIIERLTEKFNSDLYVKASYVGIIDYKVFFKQYVLEINDNKGNGKYTLRESIPIPDNFNFINFAGFIYSMNISSDNEDLKLLVKMSDYMSFYINPEKFDYSNFKPEWLLLWENDVFYKRFSKIKTLVKVVKEELSKNFNAKLSEIYFKYFV